MLSIAGWLSWQAIRGVVPWASPVLAYGLALLATVGLLVFCGYHIGSEGKAAAVAERDLQWTRTIKEKTDELDTLRERARRAADAEPASPAVRAERLRLCKQSPTCRDRGK